MSVQSVIWPWTTTRWEQCQSRIAASITTITALDSMMSSIYGPRLKPKLVSALFGEYFGSTAPQMTESEFLTQLLPFIQQLALDAPVVFKGVEYDILSPDTPSATVMTRPQAASLLACIFFGVFEYKYITNGPLRVHDMSSVSLVDVFVRQQLFGLQCMLNYFAVIHALHDAGDAEDLFRGEIIYIKRAVTAAPDWSACHAPIPDVYFGKGPYDNADTKMYIVSASNCISSLLGGPATTEDAILFTHTEAIAAMFLCGRMGAADATVVIGAGKLAEYSGRGDGTRFVGSYTEETPIGYSRDTTEAIVQCGLIFIDVSPETAIQDQAITRFADDLNKAYAGFSAAVSTSSPIVSTTQWRCQNTGSNYQVRFLQLAIAAAANGLSIAYYAEDPSTDVILGEFVAWVLKEQFDVSELIAMYAGVMSSSGKNLRSLDIFRELMQMELR